MLLRTVDVEVFQPDNGTACLGDDLPHIAVERELRECIGIERILAASALGKAVLPAAVGRGGGGVEERDACPHRKVQERLGVGVVHLHHVVDIILHRIRARALVEDCVDVRAVEVALLDEVEEVVLLLVVNEMQSAQVLVVLAVCKIVDDEDVLVPALIQCMDEIAADKAGTTGNDNHEFAPS